VEGIGPGLAASSTLSTLSTLSTSLLISLNKEIRGRDIEREIVVMVLIVWITYLSRRWKTCGKLVANQFPKLVDKTLDIMCVCVV